MMYDGDDLLDDQQENICNLDREVLHQIVRRLKLKKRYRMVFTQKYFMG